MQFIHEKDVHGEYTFGDLFILQQFSDIHSRMDISLTPDTPLSTTIPIISANMNSVTGKRMSETLARYGGMGVLPQDMSLEKLLDVISKISSAHTKYDTPLTVTLNHKIGHVKAIIEKRSHNMVIVIDESHCPIGVLTMNDIRDTDIFTEVSELKLPKPITAKEGISHEEAFDLMTRHRFSSLPIVNNTGALIGILTKNNTVRAGMYSPSLNQDKKLNVAVAIGINHYKDRIRPLRKAGIDTFVLDTAHGYQKNMLEAIAYLRSELGDEVQIIAGNICSADGARALIEAGANGVKVGIGPGAMCTTRMQTGVGRPQFSAVKECAEAIKKLGGYVWADGGVKNPRDMALALAAGASHVMIGSILAGTYESTGEMKHDEKGKYKESYGMASGKAVLGRNSHLSEIEQARRNFFKEGISTSKIYQAKGRESVGNLLDEFTTGLRSTMTYSGASDLREYHEKVIVGVQTSAGYIEGMPHSSLN